jgi:molybdopterin-dependent oxidoreductase alpha subunit
MKLFGWNSAHWASLIPNGLGHVKPNHYVDMLRIAWQNRDQPLMAWRILNDGVCDGCALGTTGLHDFTMTGVHLCMVRLNLLRLNTMPALDPALLADVPALRRMKAGELRKLGRLPYPMMRRRGDKGFRRINWAMALDTIGAHIRDTTPQRLAFYVTSRGVTNEVYYAAQKVARFLGTNNVDTAARICHSPSTVAMKDVLGVSASTCSYTDWIGSDLVIFIGSDAPNNQPVTTKYLYYAKQRGTKIAVVNTYREPGLERYWVPSVFESALFGTRLADEFYMVHTGGDLAFINGVMKHLIENGWCDDTFISEHTANFELLKAELAAQPWEMLETYSGASRAEMLRFAEMYRQAKTAVIVWSMGVTQHANGVNNIKSILNLALARGMIGREKCGVMPIRGHSGVQGGAEVGCSPWYYPGGETVGAQAAEKLSQMWIFSVPTARGQTCLEMIDGAHAGQVDVLYSVGGNFLETLPDPGYIHKALERPRLRVHQDIVLTTQMLVDPADTVILLPAQTRYEQRGGGTETSTERRIIFSPEIRGRRIGESKPEWEILMLVAEHTFPNRKHQIHFKDAQQIRCEIAQTVPSYAGIEKLKKKGDAVQWGGVRLCEGGQFSTPDARAVFTALKPPEHRLVDGWCFMSTRRGKQFNSMVHGARDPLNGAKRDDVLMSAVDAAGQGLSDGDPILLHSATGEMHGCVKIAAIKPRNLQVHWPEGNRLLPRDVYDSESGVPDYNTLVQVIKV